VEEIRSSPGAACSRAGEIERDVAQLYHEFSSGLFRYAVVLTANREAAQDAIQEAFLRYFRALSDRRSIEQPRAWLFRVLRNYLLDELKASAVRKEVDIAQLRDYPDSRQDPESDFRLSQILRSLRDVLSPRELECFRLRAVGLSYDEIAEVLDVRPGTVGALLTRAQKKLWSGPPARNGGTPAAGHGGVDTAVAGQRPAPQSPRG
jgi:RNA polymerase sigma-70 factor (ECF subfamily)